ncbi:hypothetical protein FK220_018680 [Flavobacteriaceae bacterium TP-CH-4]|uniref:Uncharacterized protein n=1 Tax=Pelagihabitans pacificus TaxID=2696054 RepID=A0A967AVW8_9FLAO|nr:hypothetical protein [Pelagihabitans pacificus]NHF61386.1 hypothetical protein [Pelagihabitans pacificus]
MEINKIGLYCVFFTLNLAVAQVKIGDNPETIDAASILELESSNGVLVLSRLTEAQMQSLVPLEGAIVYNTTSQCVFYYNSGQWNNLCNSSGNGVSFVDNGNGTFTIDVGNGPITFNGAPETTSTLVDNSNGTYTYTNEIGEETLISEGGPGGTTITDNGDGTYTVDDGVNSPFTFNGALETVSTLIDNSDGTYTYTNEEGGETIISTGGPGGTSITDNGDGTYTVDDGVNPPFTFDGAPETLTSITDNDDGSYTYRAEDGLETLITTGILGGDHIGTAGSVFFANSSTGAPFEANDDFFWDNTNKRLGIGTNTPTNELEVDGIIKSGRISNSVGTADFPSYHFTTNFNSGMFSPASGAMALASEGQEVVRVTGGNRVGIMVTNPQATLHVGGNLIVDGTITYGGGGTVLSKSPTDTKGIRRLSTPEVVLSKSDDTVILEGTVTQIVLPPPGPSNTGHVYIIKDLGGVPTTSNIPYVSGDGESSTTIKKGVLWLQSDGTDWQQIN